MKNMQVTSGKRFEATYTWPDGSELEVTEKGFHFYDKKGHHQFGLKEN